MKKLLFLSVMITLLITSNNLLAQSGIITTVAGNGGAGYSGDGGAATNTTIYHGEGVAVDNFGNIYIADGGNQLIRKVNPAGIITTIAGTLTIGYSGDGGPATAANLYSPTAVCIDDSGYIFIADQHNSRIRKINPSGIITTVAGNGTIGHSGDGYAATLASLNVPSCVSIDKIGNLYISETVWIRKVDPFGIITTIAGNGTAGFRGDGGPATAAAINMPYFVATDNFANTYFADGYNNRIRKIDTFGIITTIAGAGIAGFSGDGGAATIAQLNNPNGVATDNIGNIYIADCFNSRIRKIDAYGIITTLAGTATAGYSGDGGAATNAKLSGPMGITADKFNNIFVSDGGNNRIRKVSSIPTVTADSFSVYVNNYCGGLQFELIANSYSAGQYIKSYFGNNSVAIDSTSLCGTKGLANFFEPYLTSGVYTIKHILYNGTSAADSVTYSFTVSLCQSLSLKFYDDALGTCVYDSSDKLIPLPLLVEVGLNGVPFDTVSATSGLYYTSYGNPGDIYSFRIISAPAGVYQACPSSGVIYDTLFVTENKAKYFGFHCSTTSSFDMEAFMGARTGRHMQTMNFDVTNALCTPEVSTLNLNFSPKYVFESASPAPTSVSGTTATWNLGAMSMFTSPKNIGVTLHVPGVWLTIGDTVNTECIITPIIGDTDTTNNIIIRTDTVKGSFDPNEIAVTPSGCIAPWVVTPLQYTIMFENTGNDTAQNIYVMDTLSDNLDAHSLRIVAASNIMNVSKWYDSTYNNIFKFEFPNIKLLDSSHHNQCDGMLIYNINTKAGLPAGTNIFNHAGIFFDDNPVVTTNTVENITGCALNTRTLLPAPSLYLYPNPATDELTITTEVGTYTSFTINNMIGQEVMQQTLTNARTKVNVGSLQAGVYYIVFAGEKGNVVRKFVKM